MNDGLDRTKQLSMQVGRAVFGDRIGFTIWIGLALALALTWRVGFFITDTYAIANTVVAVSQGHLAVTEIRYAPSIIHQPGLHESGGQLYGRNYGQVILAVPFVYLLQIASAIAPLQIVIAGAWSGGVLVLGRQLARITGRERIRVAASFLAIGSFVLSITGAQGINPDRVHLVALQVSTLCVAAFGGVFAYRLLDRVHGQAVGIGAGLATGLATPLAVWATIPKRHVLIATLLVGITYCFAESRHASGRRAGVSIFVAYVLAGYVAWVHAFEGVFVLGSLLAVDLLTLRTRSGRATIIRLAAIAIGLLPMLLTNLAISGSVFQPPRLLPTAGASDLGIAPSGEVVDPTSDPGGGGSGGSGQAGNGGTGSGKAQNGTETPTDGGQGGIASSLENIRGWVENAIGTVVPLVGFLSDIVNRGLGTLSDPTRLWHIFGRSGLIPGIDHELNSFEAIDLSVLESSPLLGALLGAPVLLAAKLRHSTQNILGQWWPLSPTAQTDLLVVVLGSTFTVAYLHTLPLHSQITVRYILPPMILAIYPVARLHPIRVAVSHDPTQLLGQYGWVLIGSLVGAIGILSWLDVAVGEGMQFHALVNLSAVGILALAVAGRAVAPAQVPRHIVASALALAAGLTTTFVAMMAFSFFQYGTYAISIGRYLSTLFPAV
jgi:hypothetical protein